MDVVALVLPSLSKGMGSERETASDSFPVTFFVVAISVIHLCSSITFVLHYRETIMF